MHISAGFLGPEMFHGRAGDIVGAIQMYIDHGLPLLRRHLVKIAVPQDTGDVDHRINSAEGIDGGLYHCPRVIGAGYIAAVGHGLAARRLDFRHDFLRRGLFRRLAVQIAAEIVHHDLCAGRRQAHGHGAANTPPGARDQGDLAIHQTHDLLHRWIRKILEPKLALSAGPCYSRPSPQAEMTIICQPSSSDDDDVPSDAPTKSRAPWGSFARCLDPTKFNSRRSGPGAPFHRQSGIQKCFKFLLKSPKTG